VQVVCRSSQGLDAPCKLLASPWISNKDHHPSNGLIPFSKKNHLIIGSAVFSFFSNSQNLENTSNQS
jgi:hypothetical protein